MKRALLAVVLASTGIACGAESKVVRVYDGRVVEGAYVPPEAYAFYLRGALAAEKGDLRGALAAYEEALGEDDEDPEVWTRVGDVRCRLDPKDTKADDAIGRALKIDATYAPAHAARAACLSARGKQAEAAEAAKQASAYDPSNVDVEALVVRTAKPNAQLRERTIALTLAHGERIAAWEALVHWGRSHADAELLARGLEGLVRISPTRSPEVERGALELLGQGYGAYARRVAGAIADVPQDDGGYGPRDATVARLAVDDAVIGGDQARVERRAVRAHVALAEVAARALLLDRRDLSLRLAQEVTRADPRSSGAQMVLAALATRPQEASLPASAAEPAPEACALVLADAIASTSRPEVARAWLSRMQRTPMPAHDPVVSALAVDLAARGVLSPDELNIEHRIELAARNREAPPPIASLPPGAVDAKHAFLFHVLTNPSSKEAQALYARLAPAVDRDALVGFAVARVLLGKDSTDWTDVRRAIAAAPSHPLLLAVAVELAKRMGKADELPPARARLLAVARTAAERALATE